MWGWIKKHALPFVLKNLLPLLVEWINDKIKENKEVTVGEVRDFIVENR